MEYLDVVFKALFVCIFIKIAGVENPRLKSIYAAQSNLNLCSEQVNQMNKSNISFHIYFKGPAEDLNIGQYNMYPFPLFAICLNQRPYVLSNLCQQQLFALTLIANMYA